MLNNMRLWVRGCNEKIVVVNSSFIYPISCIFTARVAKDG